jgi:endonuclease/exonuclease/phosphatase family metal-dependent hydrolase
VELNDTTNLIILTDIYKVFHPATVQDTFFLGGHSMFSKIDHILGHKASLNKSKKIEITPCILSDHNTIKLELNTEAA